MVEFEVRHTPEELKRAYTEWWEARYRGAYRISFWIAVAAFAGMLLMRSAPWPLVVVAVLAASYAALLTTQRDTALRLALQYLDILGPEPFRYRVSAAGMREITAAGECELRWSAFESVVRQSNAVLLVRKPSEAQNVIILPLSQIPSEIPNLLEGHIRSSSRPDPPSESP
jgi:hypothetical protein